MILATTSAVVYIFTGFFIASCIWVPILYFTRLNWVNEVNEMSGEIYHKDVIIQKFKKGERQKKDPNWSPGTMRKENRPPLPPHLRPSEERTYTALAKGDDFNM